jgi:ElaB/YqjD/DUF883 family membrane-anchored ribosome-binding protein
MDTLRVLDYPTTPAVTEELRILISTVEDFLSGVHAATDSELGRLRARTVNALVRAKASVDSYAAQVREERAAARKTGTNVEVYVRGRPWVAVGLTALLVFPIGLYAGRSIAESR